MASNRELITEELSGDADVKIRPVKSGGTEFTALYIDGITDQGKLSDFIVRALQSEKPVRNLDEALGSGVAIVNARKVTGKSEMIKLLLSGNALLFDEKGLDALALDVVSAEGRGITEPPTSMVTNGPREGFVESLKKNVTLIRKRLRTDKFRQITLNIGKYTDTLVSICYIEGIADEKLALKIKERLEKTQVDGVIDSSYLTRYVDGNGSTLFKMCGKTEKPDIAVAKMLEGRIAVIADGSPIVLTLPYMFIEDIQTSEDYFISPGTATFSRYTRLMAILASIFIPGLYVSLQTYNYQIIPLKFLLTIMNATQSIPFDPLTEMIFVMLLFDIIREANFRMHKYAGLALSIVGAVVLGDAAVKAGLLGAPAVVIGALSGIGLYAMPDNTILFTVLRLCLTLIGGITGIFGIIIASLIVLTYLTGIDCFGTPYMAPFAPYIASDKRDAVMKATDEKLTKRPKSIGSKNKTRYRFFK